VAMRRVDAWPGSPRVPDTDDLFPEGWHRAAELAALDPDAMRSRAEALGTTTLMEFDQIVAADRTRPDAAPSRPRTLSVSSLIDYARCPKLFFWSQVRPLPRRSSRAAR